MVIMMNGLPLSGKTTIARFLSKEMSLTYIATNIIRDKLKLLDKLFDESFKETIYDNLIDEYSKDTNKYGQIIDATFNKKYRREKFYNAVGQDDLIIINVTTDQKEVQRRQKERIKMPDSVDYQGKNTFNYVKKTAENIIDKEIKNLPSVTFITIETFSNFELKCELLYTNSKLKYFKTILELVQQIKNRN